LALPALSFHVDRKGAEGRIHGEEGKRLERSKQCHWSKGRYKQDKFICITIVTPSRLPSSKVSRSILKSTGKRDTQKSSREAQLVENQTRTAQTGSRTENSPNPLSAWIILY
jgi:hypothetical protein